MYSYTEFDDSFIAERNAQFRAQVERRLDGSLTEDEFKPLRLMNGLYLQLHAYMLRVAIPYGTLGSRQMHKLADIADKWDKGYGHFTTRQNIQYNWPQLRDVPDMLDALAEVNMHAIQTSGNTIRNVTADHFAGAAADEIADPRPVAELIRQWSTDHPEFQFLPRKFKVAVSGAAHDRAVIKAHDIGLQIVEQNGVLGFQVIVGGGLGRTPMIGKVLYDFVSSEDLLPTLEAIVSVYNLLGRRDNKYKARIKITVHENGIDDIRARVIERYALIRPQFTGVDQQILARIEADFVSPNLKTAPINAYTSAYDSDPIFRSWADTNLTDHRNPSYAIIACPGMDYCALATARSIPIAQEIATRFDELKLEHDIGPLKIKISGCINACGHHHVGHIGILGLDRAGVENYQITLGGDGTETATIGERAGPGFSADDIVPAIERLVLRYLALRTDASETFLQTFRRMGLAPFKTALYPEARAHAA